MPKHIFELALANGVDGCLTAVTRSVHSDKSLLQTLDLHSRRARDPPLAVFVTMCETAGESDAIQQVLANHVWRDPAAEPRIVFCAPGLYASIVSTLQHSFDPEELDKTITETLPNPNGPLKPFEPFLKSLKCRVV